VLQGRHRQAYLANVNVGHASTWSCYRSRQRDVSLEHRSQIAHASWAIRSAAESAQSHRSRCARVRLSGNRSRRDLWTEHGAIRRARVETSSVANSARPPRRWRSSTSAADATLGCEVVSRAADIDLQAAHFAVSLARHGRTGSLMVVARVGVRAAAEVRCRRVVFAVSSRGRGLATGARGLGA